MMTDKKINITDWVRARFFDLGKNKQAVYSKYDECKAFFKIEYEKDISAESFSRTVRMVYNELYENVNTNEEIEEYNTKVYNVGNILVVGDLHEPFSNDGYLAFCIKQYKRFKCQCVVFIGDVVDNHAMSYHEHNPNGESATTELEKAIERIKKWYTAFPEAYVCMGNHDRLIERKAVTNGMPKQLFKTFKEIIKAPDEWKFSLLWEIDDIIFTHGTGSSGQYAFVQRAVKNRKSTVMGHVHHVLATRYMASQHDRIFAMSTGCGIDVHAYAFEYGIDFMNRPVLGCGVIVDIVDAFTIPMRLE